MWFVFPQLAGLGRSETARFYGFTGEAEAAAFLRHPVLGNRLRTCTGLVNAGAGRDAHAIFGSPDDLKFHSCATLFARLAQAGADEDAVFRTALDRFFAGREDAGTVSLLGAR